MILLLICNCSYFMIKIVYSALSSLSVFVAKIVLTCMVSLCIPSPFSWSLDQEFDSPCMDVAELGPSSNSNFGEVDLMF